MGRRLGVVAKKKQAQELALLLASQFPSEGKDKVFSEEFRSFCLEMLQANVFHRNVDMLVQHQAFARWTRKRDRKAAEREAARSLENVEKALVAGLRGTVNS